MAALFLTSSETNEELGQFKLGSQGQAAGDSNFLEALLHYAFM